MAYAREHKEPGTRGFLSKNNGAPSKTHLSVLSVRRRVGENAALSSGVPVHSPTHSQLTLGMESFTGPQAELSQTGVNPAPLQWLWVYTSAMESGVRPKLLNSIQRDPGKLNERRKAPSRAQRQKGRR